MKKLAVVALALLLAACGGLRPASEAPAGVSRAATAQEITDNNAMAAGHVHDAPVATPAATTTPAVPTTEERVAYGEVGGARVYGYLAKPAAAKRALPGLIVIHEWWGLNDNVRNEARRLAAEGYVTLAVDLYGGQVAAQPPDAIKLLSAVTQNPGAAEENLRQAYAYLRKTMGAPSIGTIGWCFGGGWSLRAAVLFPKDVNATVIYYGSVKVPEEQLATLQMPILGLFGSMDKSIPPDTAKAFEATMQRLGKNVEVKIYDGAGHAFANPSGTSYQAAAAEDAWQRTLRFLRENLQRRQG